MRRRAAENLRAYDVRPPDPDAGPAPSRGQPAEGHPGARALRRPRRHHRRPADPRRGRRRHRVHPRPATQAARGGQGDTPHLARTRGDPLALGSHSRHLRGQDRRRGRPRATDEELGLLMAGQGTAEECVSEERREPESSRPPAFRRFLGAPPAPGIPPQPSSSRLPSGRSSCWRPGTIRSRPTERSSGEPSGRRSPSGAPCSTRRP